ncbi:MAG TPA: M4 family metallopeptidase [Chitinispirillaceae bacterium]|nr:M4 family metallopeptidase [Chitinispirillaceae bacterium]
MFFKTTLSLVVSLIVSSTFSPIFALSETFTRSGNSLRKPTSTSQISSDTLSIRYDIERKTPFFISGKIVEPPSGSQVLKKMSAAAQKRALCRSFLSKIGPALRIAHPEDELSVTDIDEAKILTPQTAHFKIRQKYRGITILGAEATVHLKGERADFVGRTIATPDLDIVPSFTANQAIGHVLKDLHNNNIKVQKFSPDEQEFLDYKEPSAQLIVYPSLESGSTDCLAYQIFVRPNMLDWWEYIVDAHTGEFLLKYNRTSHFGDTTVTAKDYSGNQREIHTYLSDKHYLIDASRAMFDPVKSQIPNKLTGAIVTYDYNNKYPSFSSYSLITPTHNGWDPKAVSAHYNSSAAYEYYLNTHGRNSINGLGGTIRSFINVADQSGWPLDNAYWNGKGMYYGNGSQLFTSLVNAIDVAAHELTHGVIETTAGLRYIGQSGALNESMADIFACMVDRSNWTIGETVMRPGVYPTNVLRDLSNPHNGARKGEQGWQPKNMSEYKKLPNTTTGDNGGVHVNNSIPSYAYYLFATEVGKEKAERIFYRTLTTYLSASSQFADLRIGARLACEDLHGKESAEMTALMAAFDSVGILEDTEPFTPVADLPVNTGKEYVLLTAAPAARDGTTLYIADSLFGSLKSVSKRPVSFRPSVSDDGSKVLFVSNKRLVSLTLNGDIATETIIDSSRVWALCAISRDGRHYAAVREENDTSIYIGSMSDGSVRRYNLNGPVEQQVATGAVNSTALEWNLTDDEVIYDVFNSLQAQGSSGLQFWDIGFLRSWDAEPDTFGDGSISKLFNNLGDGLSVGNPTYSKNSPNIIAYELVDNLTYTVTVMTMNMENRKTVAVAPTEYPGYPSYSRLDDKLAFSTISGRDTVISVVKLKDDKQTPVGEPTIAISKMKWPVYFATGLRNPDPTRSRSDMVKRPSKPGLSVVPYKGRLKMTITGVAQSQVRISIIRADGKIVDKKMIFATRENVPYIWNSKNAGGGFVGSGIYFIRMETPHGAVVKKIAIF